MCVCKKNKLNNKTNFRRTSKYCVMASVRDHEKTYMGIVSITTCQPTDNKQIRITTLSAGFLRKIISSSFAQTRALWKNTDFLRFHRLVFN